MKIQLRHAVCSEKSMESTKELFPKRVYENTNMQTSIPYQCESKWVNYSLILNS